MDLAFVNGLPVVLQYLVFIASFALGAFALIGFCNLFIDNATLIARKFKIPSLIIGLTIVAMGTSIPELAVSVSDSIQELNSGGIANIAVGNVVGSNISNILLVISMGCFFAPIIINKENKKELYILLFITSLFTVFAFMFGQGAIFSNFAITRWEALILTMLIIFYLSYIILTSKEKIKNSKKEEEKIKKIKIFKPFVYVILAICGIAFGGELAVYGAKGIALNIASSLNVDSNLAETLVALTIVAVGTSLPELVTTFIASKKGENDIALGNVIGSNIFNIIFVLGISGMVIPLGVSSTVLIDILVMLGVTILFFILSMFGKFNRKHSYIFIGIYLTYLVYLILRTVLI
ncbi:MAG: calcium/sodium antiporter [Bacilli bacterium]|nr:calcium/sodium antiporter [Bacilli bacterium]